MCILRVCACAFYLQGSRNWSTVALSTCGPERHSRRVKQPLMLGYLHSVLRHRSLGVSGNKALVWPASWMAAAPADTGSPLNRSSGPYMAPYLLGPGNWGTLLIPPRLPYTNPQRAQTSEPFEDTSTHWDNHFFESSVVLVMLFGPIRGGGMQRVLHHLRGFFLCRTAKSKCRP